MKTHLKQVAGILKFTYEEFSALSIRVETVLNFQLMSPLTENPEELLPLISDHFLKGAPIIALPEAPEKPPIESLCLIKRSNRLKIIQHIFTGQWKNEYITGLQTRVKWKVKEDSLPPTEWRLGRVIKVFYGKDNKVQVAEIKTQNGVIVRYIVKLCFLPPVSS